MRILITGSNGLLGQKLVSALRGEPSVDLLATSRGSDRSPDPLGSRYHTLDITVKDGVVHVRAPLPRIAEVDQGPVHTIDESTGLLSRGVEVVTGDGQAIQQQELADAGRSRMLDGARQDTELFELGRQSTERTLERLLQAAPGVDRVVVDFPTIGEACASHAAPEFCAANRGGAVTAGSPQ